ncbi:putative dynamin-like protein [Gregarina niphandrodes]|uniref:Dynamin-like protein n=1 Tax=Gregarina niphandrodes TaxID=110365 RepID=A0A023BB22_GRENI|nr:putative dynamin-like protein [Gregarina niphandrodes]EZG78969.1 putative dynamin-like protein [Gregarina niphandrodes]|eukprot:XP_011129148.1 putative dynamin-like protein [Gregarina niphandrodes]
MEEPVGVYQNLRKLISVVDELRDVGLQQYIELPRIAVVGTQSAGKSSVLEGIVGMDFLPRGDGVVTRRPLELRLVHSHNGEEKTYAVFDGDNKQEKIYQMEEVRRRIERLTDEIAGKNKGIVDIPIVLRICGPECPDLTLVDLPGITRVPLKNSDQTDDIERLTREMASRYAEDPRTIILAVIPANQDISTSDALQLARRVDPRGVRTIGVITKLDLMDQGTNGARMIMGEEVPLRLGYIAVKNRSQADILGAKSVKASAEDELKFFKTHPAYKNMPPQLFGMRSLIDKLTKILYRHIRNFLPQIKSEIISRLRELKQRLSELGEGVPTEASDKTQLVWGMINDYCDVFSNTIRGKYDKRLANYVDQDTNVQCGGAFIRGIFSSLLDDYTGGQGITADMTDADIDQAIRMHEGDSLPGFPTPDTFEFLILPHLMKLQYPVLECLDQVAGALDQLLDRLSARVFARFPALGNEVLELSRSLLEKEKDKTKQIIEYVVNAEMGYMFTNDDSYLSVHASLLSANAPQNPNTVPNQQPPTQNKTTWFGPQMQQTVQAVNNCLWNERRTQYSATFLAEIRGRLNAYFNIVLRNIRDTIPKTIGYFLVRRTQETLQYELYTSLSKADLQDSLLGEPPHVTEERASIKKQMSVLNQANTVLQK